MSELNKGGGVSEPLKWMEGPARGGEGTAGVSEEGDPSWHDGDTLFIIVETTSGPEYSIVTVSADHEQLDFHRHDSGNYWDAWTDRQISWWAIVEERHLPTTGKEQG